MKIEKTVSSVVLYICSLLSAFGIETNGLLGEYYADQNFGGNPVCRVDGNINFDWKSGAPMDAFPANYFSVKWSGFLDVPEEDDYTFFASVDDGIRMYIDDAVVFDAWETGSFSRTSSALRLSAGRHKIRLEYYEYNSTAWLKLSWKNSKSTDFSIISGEYFKVDLNDGAPVLTGQPENKNVPMGRSASVSVAAAEPYVEYQWQKSADGENWENIDGANSSSYRSERVDADSSKTAYRCAVKNTLFPENTAYSDAVKFTAVEPTVFYVSTDGNDENDGMSWGAAFKSLQKAVDAADSLGGGDVWVKGGEYSFDTEIELKYGVVIRGGFAGGEKSASERVDGNETVLDGGNSHRLFSAKNIGDARLDRLTLRNGKAEKGGAVYVENAAIAIENSKLSGNAASQAGGAIAGYSNSVLSLSECSLDGNTASNGGAAAVSDGVKIEAVGCVVSGNSASGDGGAFNSGVSCDISLVSCEISGNSTSSNGGAMSIGANSNTTLRDSKIFGNKASSGGVAYAMRDNLFDISGCEVFGNSVVYSGGVIVKRYGRILSSGNSYFENSAKTGGVFHLGDVVSLLENDTIFGNKSTSTSEASAIYGYYDTNITVLNCTIVGNYCDGTSPAVRCKGVVLNSILWGNSAVNGSFQIVSDGITVKNCVVEGGYKNGENIVDSNPSLMPFDYYGGKIRVMPLDSESGAIGLGLPSASMPSGISAPSVDAYGRSRGSEYSAGAMEFAENIDYIRLSVERDIQVKDSVFEISALVGAEDVSYQWYKNGVLIEGATSKTLKISQSERSAEYTVKISKGSKSSTSESLTIGTRPAVLYVSADGSDGNDGASWETPKATVGGALAESAYGSQIWIKAGRYVFDGEVSLPAGVVIRGGFAGGEKSAAERVDGNETVLDGGNSHRLFSAKNVSDILLENLSITKGSADNGAVLYSYKSAVKFENVKAFANNASTDGGVAFAEAYSELLVENCEFTENTAQSVAGALRILDSTCVIKNSDISRNTAKSNSGGAVDSNASTLTVVSSSFKGNTTGNNGGALQIFKTKAEISDTEISGNSAVRGGGIASESSADAVFRGCSIVGNTASGNGGGCYVNASLSLVNCKVGKNRATGNGGGLFNDESGKVSVSECEVFENSAKIGGGCYVSTKSSSFSAESFSLYSNSAENYGAAYNGISKTSYSNATVAENASSDGGIDLNFYNGGTLTNCTIFGGLGFDDDSTSNIVNCIIWGKRGIYNIWNSSCGNVRNCIVKNGYKNGTDISDKNPELLPLGYYGGNVKTMPPAFGSAAIGAGISADNLPSGVSVPAKDARGIARGESYSIGAAEYSENVSEIFALSERSLYARGEEFEIKSAIAGEGFTYQWYKDGEIIDGATSPTLNVRQSEKSAKYKVVAKRGSTTVESGEVEIATAPKIIYVKTDGDDNASGESWDSAKAGLKSAIASAGYGSEIWVCKGSYAVSESLRLSDNIAIRGGFDGTESKLSERKNASTTLLDASQACTIFSALNVSNVLLENMTLTGGKALYGGALYCAWSDVNIENVRFAENITLKRTGRGTPRGSGGAVYAESDCNIKISDSLFESCWAQYGGAIYAGTKVSLEISGSRFGGNKTDSFGGAVHFSGRKLLVSDSHFEKNSSGSGGAVYFESTDDGDALLQSSVFRENSATNGGGAISLDSNKAYTVSGCLFESNSAATGGAVYASASFFFSDDKGNVFSENEFVGNKSSKTGGALYISMPTWEESRFPFVIDSNLFYGNTAATNGGAADCDYDADFVNCVFAGNSAANGGVLYSGYCNISIANCTAVDNKTTSSDAVGVYLGGNGNIVNSIVWNCGEKAISDGKTAVNCVIEGGYSGGKNILEKNPVLTPLGNYGGAVRTIGVSAYSCAIDAGATQSEVGDSPKLPSADARGVDRTAYERPTIGAFEPAAVFVDEASIIPLFGDGYYVEGTLLELSLMAFEGRISGDLSIEWFRDGEKIDVLDMLILSEMLSVGDSYYYATITVNGKTYTTGKYDVKTLPSAIYISNDGDDSNDGKTPETAKRSLDAVLKHLPYGGAFEINVVAKDLAVSDADTAFAVNALYDISAGIVLNIGDNVVLKFADHAGFNVLDGGTLNIANAVLTHIADDSVGGDTNGDGAKTLPLYDMYSISGVGNLSVSQDCDFRYKTFEYSGTLSASQFWPGGRIYKITSNIVVPDGITLSISKGAILKFAKGTRIVVNKGGALSVNGEYGNPVIMTSLLDDSKGGDTNGDGGSSLPSMGDWRSIQIYGTANFNYTDFYYGGDTDSGSWTAAQGAVLSYQSGSSGGVKNCFIVDGKFDGIISYAENLKVENTAVAFCSRLINALGGSAELVNVVGYGLVGNHAILAHGGSLTFVNGILSNVSSQFYFKESTLVVKNSLFWNEAGGGDQSCSFVGRDGNIWGNPKFRDAENLDFTIKIGSPCIDAGDGSASPDLDYFGQPRVMDSHVASSGSESSNGAIPDIGICEMTANAVSEVDIAANSVECAESVSAGESLDIVWRATNVGTKRINKVCKTSVALVKSDNSEEIEIGEIRNAVNLQPSESAEYRGSLKIPQTAQDGTWKIRIFANYDRGIFEGKNTANNTATSAGTLRVEMPYFEGDSISVNANSSAVAKFAPSDSVRSILITAPEGLKIYSACGYVPNASKCLASAVYIGQGRYLAYLPASSESAYISIANESVQNVNAKIEVSDNTLSVLATSLESLPNNGEVSFSVYGTGFTKDSTVKIYNSRGRILVMAVKYISPNELLITVSPEYASAGKYELVVNDGIAGASCANQMTVLQTSKGPILETRVIIASSARSGRDMSFKVVCRNVGDANAPLPIIKIYNYAFEIPENIPAPMPVGQRAATATYGNVNYEDIKCDFSIDGETYYTGEMFIVPLKKGLEGCFIAPNEEIECEIYCKIPKCPEECNLGIGAATFTVNGPSSKETFLVDSIIPRLTRYLAKENNDTQELEWLESVDNLIGSNNGEYVDKITNFAFDLYRNTGSLNMDVRMLRSVLFAQQNSNVADSELSDTTAGNSLFKTAKKSTSTQSSTGKHPNDISNSTVHNEVKVYRFVNGSWQLLREPLEKGCKNVIIIAHGMNDSILKNDWVSFAKTIAAKTNNTYIIGIDWNPWAEWPWIGKDEDGIPIVGGKLNPSLSAAKIKTVAADAITILGEKNITRADNIICMGHSHGGHVSGFIANALGAKRHIGMDTSTLLYRPTESIWYPSGIGHTEYYRSSQLGGRDDAYANENYIIMREKEFEDSSVSLIDDFLLNSRHGYAVSWVKNRISADGLDFNEKLHHEGMSGGFRGVVVDASHFDYYTDLIGNTFNNEKITINDINYPGGAYSWYVMYYRWISTFDFKADACPVTDWKTGKSHDFDVNFTDYADSKALKNKSVKDTSRTYSYTLKFARKTNASAPDPQTVADFNSPDYDVRTIYSENFNVRKTGKAHVTVPNKIYSLKPNEKIGIFIITEIKPSESNTVDLFSKNNETFTSGTLERTDDPVAGINNNYDDKFKIKKEFVYNTQKDLEKAKDEYYDYPLKSTSEFPEDSTLRLYRWNNGSSKNETTIRINKGTNKIYLIALTVATDGDKSDSVYGYLEVICRVEKRPPEPRQPIVPTSQDPNEMAGPSGVGDDRLVLPGQWLDFKIHFENKAEASAAAQEIRIVNKLSPYLDWNSLELGDVVFNNQIVSALSGKNSGTVEVAAKDGSQNVRIQFKMDSATGELNWYLRSVDKSTADGWPLDPYAGFLPPNDANGSGEGYVAFRVKVRGDAPSGTKIDTSATITFDYNDPIETDPSWSNTVYAGKPLDFELTPVAEIVNGSVSLSWSASDFASSYDVFVWEEGSERPDEATVSGITGTSISFDSNLSVGKKYNFTVVARNAYGETSTSSITAEAKKVATYDIWSAENLTGLASAKRAKNVEVGGDGITNIEKYVFGLSAKKATVYGENGNFGIYVDSAGVSRVRFPERKYMTDAAVRVYYSTDMQNWTTDGVVISTVSDSDEDFLVKEAYFDGVQPENIWFKVEAYECE